MITIKAREVVPGMLWHDEPIAQVLPAIHPLTGLDCREITMPAGSRHYTRDENEPWSVTLPGPSPRELLCTCGAGHGAGAAGNDVEMHAAWCPVHRLRLRVWPAPFGYVPWEAITDGWTAPGTCGIGALYTDELRTWAHDPADYSRMYPNRADILRNCFTLPADHSEQAAGCD